MDKELEEAINQRINELEEENCKLQVYLNVEYSKKTVMFISLIEILP